MLNSSHPKVLHFSQVTVTRRTSGAIAGKLQSSAFFSSHNINNNNNNKGSMGMGEVVKWKRS
jgi:hypothetical protein